MSRRGARGRAALGAAAALLLVGAASAQAASLGVADGPVVLGKTASATVVVEVDPSPGTEELPLRLSVNVGGFSEPVRIGPGRYRAVYTPPSTRFPQVALVAAWRDTGPEARIDFLRIPLLGATRIPVAAPPGASVWVRVDRETFGPAVADRAGRAEVPVLVPPGVDSCEVAVRDRRGAVTTRRVPVEVPPYNRLTAALVPQAIAADGEGEARLEVLYDVGGAEVPPDRIRVTPSAGAVTFQRASRGVYTFRFVLPAGVAATGVSFAVAVEGDPAARAGARLSVAPRPPPAVRPARAAPAPARLVLTPPARAPRAGSGETAVIDVLALDADGAGMPGLQISATANGEPLPPPAPVGDGHYELRFTAPATYPPGGLVQLEAAAHHPAGFAFGSANWQVDPPRAVRDVIPRFTPSPVPADGRTEARLVLDVRDAAGERLEGARLFAIASHGTLGKLRELGKGLYEQTYVAPADLPAGDATLRVVDGKGAFERAFPIALRPDLGRLLAGAWAGYTRSAGAASGARAGGELWVPLRLGGARLGLGAQVGVGTASLPVVDPRSTLATTADALFVPAALKLGWEAYASRRLSAVVGAGPVATWARFETSLASGAQAGLALGWMGFADLGWALGPGLAVLGLSYGSSPVATADYHIDPGGLSVALGYRLRIR